MINEKNWISSPDTKRYEETVLHIFHELRTWIDLAPDWAYISQTWVGLLFRKSNLFFFFFSDRFIFASFVQEDGRSILYSQRQGQIGSSRSPKDLHCLGFHQRQRRGQDLIGQVGWGLQDQLQREIRRNEETLRRWYLGCSLIGPHQQAREVEGSRVATEARCLSDHQQQQQKMFS